MPILVKIGLGVATLAGIIIFVYILSQIQMKAWLKQFDKHINKKADVSIKK
jgi:hypothetical protein